jgi:hypothetical protein
MAATSQAQAQLHARSVQQGAIRDRLLGFAAAALYQPVDTEANRKNWKAGTGDWAWSTVKIVPGPIVMPSLMITVMPSVIVMGKCRRNQDC